MSRVPPPSSSDEALAKSRQIKRVLANSGEPLDVPDGKPLEADLRPDRTRQFRSVGFSRARTTWSPEEAITMEQINRHVNDVIERCFREAFIIRDRIWKIVREPEVDDRGEIVLALDHRPVWRRDEDGMPVEDWTLLGSRDRELLGHAIVVRLVEWGQLAGGQWGDAMMAKGIYEEAFARGFLAPSDDSKRLTVDDRTQAGHVAALDQRYHALFRSILSRRADAVVSSMRYLEQRLRESPVY